MTTHPERFRPLHEVGDALIAHLVASYDVEAAQWSRRARRRSAADGGRASSGESVADTLPAERLRMAAEVLGDAHAGWAAWPARRDG